MLKVRLQGTKEDMQQFEKKLEEYENIKVISSSGIFENKGTKKYFRKYLEVELV